VLAAGLILTLALAGCGRLTGDGDGDAGAGGAGGAGALGRASSPDAGPAGGADQVTVDKTVWYGGMKWTLNAASVRAADIGDGKEVVVEAVIQNNSSVEINLGNVRMSVNVDGASYDGGIAVSTMLAGGASGKQELRFPVEEVKDLGTGVLTLGKGDEAQPVVPFGQGELVAMEPKTVLDKAATVTFKPTRYTVKACELRADFPPERVQAGKGKRLVTCALTVQSTGGWIYYSSSEFGLKEPDGNVIAATYDDFVGRFDLFRSGERKDIAVAWEIDWPISGAYALSLAYLGQQGNGDPRTAKNTREIPLDLA